MKKLIRVTSVPLSLSKLLGKQLTYMNTFYEVTAVCSNAEELAKLAQKFGVRHFHVEMTRQITPLQDLVGIYKLYLFLRIEKPDIVHSHTPKAGLVAMLAAWLARVPVRMHTVAGLPLLEATGSRRKVLNLVEKLIYGAATHVYPNSAALRDIIIGENFCAAAKLKVIAQGSSNGIDTNHFSNSQIADETRQNLRETLNLQPEDFVFLFVGRLVRDKGINELVSAFTALEKHSDATCGTDAPADPARNPRASYPPKDQNVRRIKLILVGPLEQHLNPLSDETVQQIESNPDIITTGFRDDVRPYMAISHAFVFPSYREGFPNVVLQAGSMELPCIVSDINGCNEIIRHRENGLIIPPKNTDALLGAMQELMHDSDVRRSLTRNLRAEIEEKYSQQKVWAALKEEYERLTS